MSKKIEYNEICDHEICDNETDEEESYIKDENEEEINIELFDISNETKEIEQNEEIIKKKQYFDLNVQNWIITYQSQSKREKKNKIYTKYIHPAFVELVDSLVVVYNFKSSNEDINHLKNDCITFLFETLNKYDASKGTKAFSYFNVVAKNWLIIQSRKLLKHKKRSAYIDDEEGLTNEEKLDLIEKTYFIEKDFDQQENDDRLNLEKLIKVLNYVDIHLKDEKDKKCSYAIRKIYTDIDSIEFFNKRAVFVYLREISGLNSNELSLSLSNIRKIYRKKIVRDKTFDLSKRIN